MGIDINTVSNPKLREALLRLKSRELAKDYAPKTGSEIPNPKPERDQTAALESANAGKAPGVQRTRVRFIGYRVRPLDPDNFAGSVKDLLDGLRHAGLISGDEPWRITLETEQIRVNHFNQEKTVIELETL